MEKPILLRRKDFTNDMINLIDNSDIPLILIEPILQEILNNTRTRLGIQYKKEEEEWEKYLEEKNNSK